MTNKKLYLGGISYNTTEDTIRDLFADAGEVESVNVIMDRETGRSKGFAFVEMGTVEEAQEAIQKFNGVELDGRRITVNESRPQEPRNNRGPRSSSGHRGGGGGGGGGRW